MKVDRLQVLKLWNDCHLLGPRQDFIKKTCDRLFSYKELFYEPVEKSLGIPWYLIGALDYRESSFDHKAYLGNGDPLNKKTVHVPRGRGPFKNWHEGAIDALVLDGINKLPEGGHWDIVTVLIKAEGYNGFGYRARGLPSPYVWGGTTIQRAGKYVADGKFDQNAWDTQLGCAALFLGLRTFYGVNLRED